MKRIRSEAPRVSATRRAWWSAALLLGCAGLAGMWSPIQTVASNLGRELSCWGSTARRECIQQKRQDAERRSLKSIEDELRSLK